MPYRRRLSEAVVLAIWHSTLPTRELAQQYHVSVSMITCIKQGSVYKNVTRHLGKAAVSVTRRNRDKRKLTDDEALNALVDKRSAYAIAHEYGVGINVILRIRKGLTYRNITSQSKE